MVSHPYRGATVADITQEEISEVLVPIRTVIERVAFTSAAIEGEERLLHQLELIVSDMEKASQPLDARRLADLDVSFHETVIAAAGHTQSLQVWRLIQPRVRAYFLRDAGHHDDPASVVRQHRELLAALRSGDPARAGVAAEEHILTYLEQPSA